MGDYFQADPDDFTVDPAGLVDTYLHPELTGISTALSSLMKLLLSGSIDFSSAL